MLSEIELLEYYQKWKLSFNLFRNVSNEATTIIMLGWNGYEHPITKYRPTAKELYDNPNLKRQCKLWYGIPEGAAYKLNYSDSEPWLSYRPELTGFKEVIYSIYNLSKAKGDVLRDWQKLSNVETDTLKYYVAKIKGDCSINLFCKIIKDDLNYDICAS